MHMLAPCDNSWLHANVHRFSFSFDPDFIGKLPRKHLFSLSGQNIKETSTYNLSYYLKQLLSFVWGIRFKNTLRPKINIEFLISL